jgi:hypothetical protein
MMIHMTIKESDIPLFDELNIIIKQENRKEVGGASPLWHPQHRCD